jgi:hypothetical protein
VRPGRVLLGGLAVLYLLAYLRGTALLVAATAAAGWLLWRARRASRQPVVDGAGGGPGWVVDDGRVATALLAAEAAEADHWQLASTAVHGVPEAQTAGQPDRFVALVELRDHAGRQATLQVGAAYPAEVDLERLVRQALTQAARRAGWRVERWQLGTDADFAPTGWDQVEGWAR